jgi:hypothetical protein
MRKSCKVRGRRRHKAPKIAVVDLGTVWKRATYRVNLETSPEQAAIVVERCVYMVRRLLQELLPTAEEVWVSVVARLPLAFAHRQHA